MEQLSLTQQYRELDRDLAQLYYRIGRYSEETRKIRPLFIPTEENKKEAGETLKDLKRRVENLAAPDGVYLLVKHHLEDFTDSLGYTLEEAFSHPENPYLDLDSILEGTARCSRQPDEDRLEQLLLLFRQLPPR